VPVKLLLQFVVTVVKNKNDEMNCFFRVLTKVAVTCFSFFRCAPPHNAKRQIRTEKEQSAWRKNYIFSVFFFIKAGVYLIDDSPVECCQLE
jgi:hypothetical protein